MADSTAQIGIQINDSDVGKLIDSLWHLESTIDSLIVRMDRLGDEADDAGDEVAQAGRKAKQAESKVSGLSRATSDLGRAFSSMAGGAFGAVAGVAALGTAEQALQTVINGVTAAVSAAAEKSEALGLAVAASKSAVESFQVALGEALVGGENTSVVFGTFTGIMESLTNVVNENADTIASMTRGALQLFLNVIAGSIRLVGRVITVFSGLKVASLELERAINSVVSGIAQFGLAIQQGIVGLAQDAIDAFTGIVGAAGAAAEALGLNGVAQTIRTAQEGLEGLSTSLGDSSDRLEAMRDEARRAGLEIDGRLNRAIVQQIQANEDYTDTFNELADAVSNATANTDALARATERVSSVRLGPAMAAGAGGTQVFNMSVESAQDLGKAAMVAAGSVRDLRDLVTEGFVDIPQDELDRFETFLQTLPAQIDITSLSTIAESILHVGHRVIQLGAAGHDVSNILEEFEGIFNRVTNASRSLAFSVAEQTKDTLILTEGYNKLEPSALAAAGAQRQLSKALAQANAELKQHRQLAANAIEMLNDFKTATKDLGLESVADTFVMLGESIGEALTGGLDKGESVAKRFGRILGGLLKQIGAYAIAMGTIALIPPPYNPNGNPAAGAALIAGGVAAVALGSAIGGASEAGTGSGRRAAAGSSPSNMGGGSSSASEGSTTVINLNNSFGSRFDAREIDRAMAMSLERAQMRGQA